MIFVLCQLFYCTKGFFSRQELKLNVIRLQAACDIISVTFGQKRKHLFCSFGYTFVERNSQRLIPKTMDLRSQFFRLQKIKYIWNERNDFEAATTVVTVIVSTIQNWTERSTLPKVQIKNSNLIKRSVSVSIQFQLMRREVDLVISRLTFQNVPLLQLLLGWSHA